MKKLGPFMTPNTELLFPMIKNILSQDGKLFEEMMLYNKHTSPKLQEFIDVLQMIHDGNTNGNPVFAKLFEEAKEKL